MVMANECLYLKKLHDTMILNVNKYWFETNKFSDVWLEFRPPCDNPLTGYSRIAYMTLPEINYPFGQPFFSSFNFSAMEDLELIIEEEKRC